MANEKVCDRHGRYERRTCPACAWCSANPGHVKFKSGCPLCGEALDDNTRHLMSCTNDDCPMMTTSHPPPQIRRRRVQPSAVGLKGRRL